LNDIQKSDFSIRVSNFKDANFINGIVKKLLIISPEAFWVLLGQIGTATISILGIKLLTHVLNVGEFGRLSLANTIMGLIGTNLFGPLGQGLMRFWSIAKDRNNLEEFYILSNRFAKIVTYIALIITCVLAIVVSSLKGINWGILLILSCIIGTITGWLSLRLSIFTCNTSKKNYCYS